MRRGFLSRSDFLAKPCNTPAKSLAQKNTLVRGSFFDTKQCVNTQIFRKYIDGKNYLCYVVDMENMR